jgi:hypothetical protein
MSYDARFTGSLHYASEQALQDAVSAMRNAIADHDDRYTFVEPEELRIEDKCLSLDAKGSCPASMWGDTMEFLAILGRTAIKGTIDGYYEGELSETIEAGEAPSGETA